jgi:Carboxypeptidase regulatory-like domain
MARRGPDRRSPKEHPPGRRCAACRRPWVLIAATLVPALLAGHAQSTTTGGLDGVVTDAQGRVIPGVRVVAKSSATSKERTATTDAAGSFQIGDLDPETYTIQATTANFAPWLAPSVTIEVGRITTLAPHLAIAGHSETVLVQSEAPGLETSSAAISTNFSNTALENLPSNGCRWSNFALLAAGVTPDQNGDGLLSFRGINVLLNNNTIDGVDNNQAFFSEERGRTRIGYSTTQAAVQEFQVNTSNYAAEYGRAAGGVVNTVTRSGGNQFHGQAFFFDESLYHTHPASARRRLYDNALPPDRLAQTVGSRSRRTHPARQALLVFCLRSIPAKFSRHRAHRRCALGNRAGALRHTLRARA